MNDHECERCSFDSPTLSWVPYLSEAAFEKVRYELMAAYKCLQIEDKEKAILYAKLSICSLARRLRINIESETWLEELQKGGPNEVRRSD
jgi:hypothetical protein